MAKWHECIHPTCHDLIQYPDKYCDKHRQIASEKRAERIKQHSSQRNKFYNQHNRDREANSFYQSKAWKSTRNYVINRDHYMCCICGEPVNNRKIIDHIVPRKIDKSKELEISNLWTLCYRCHTIKTSIEEQLINSANGINKVKHLTKNRWVKYIRERLERNK